MSRLAAATAHDCARVGNARVLPCALPIARDPLSTIEPYCSRYVYVGSESKRVQFLLGLSTKSVLASGSSGVNALTYTTEISQQNQHSSSPHPLAAGAASGYNDSQQSKPLREQARGASTRSNITMSTETLTRSQIYKHNDLIAWLTENGHITPQSSQVEVVAAAFARRNEYRATDRYRTLAQAGDPEKAAKAEAAAAAKAEAKAAKDAERAAAKEAKEAEKAAKAEAAAAAKAEKAAKVSAPDAPPAKATKTSKKASKAAAEGEEDPFA